MTSAHAKALLEARGRSTLGDHSFDQRHDPVLRSRAAHHSPAKLFQIGPGKGAFEVSRGRKCWRRRLAKFSRNALDDPFSALETVLKAHPMGGKFVNASLIDIHCEATFRKNGCGLHLLCVMVALHRCWYPHSTFPSSTR
jgi:calcineurin-like phosphoesterase